MNIRQKFSNLGKKLKPNTTSSDVKSASLTRIGYNVAEEQVSAVCIMQSLHTRCGYFGISATQGGNIFQVQLRLLYIFITRAQISLCNRNASW